MNMVKTRRIPKNKSGGTAKPKKTWRTFMKGKMSKYMKAEGSHGGAIRRMGREWTEYKKEHGMK